MGHKDNKVETIDHPDSMATMSQYRSIRNLAAVHALGVDIITAFQELKAQPHQLGMDTGQFAAKVLPTAHSQHSRQIKHIFARAHMEAPFSPK
jgi:hypothetical protein